MQYAFLKAYDTEGNELAHYTEYGRETNFGNYEFIEEEYVDFQRRWDVRTAPLAKGARMLDGGFRVRRGANRVRRRSARDVGLFPCFSTTFLIQKEPVDSVDNPSGLPTLTHRLYFDIYHGFLSHPNQISTPDLTLHVIGSKPVVGKTDLNLEKLP